MTTTRALISVSDKTGIVTLAQRLRRFGVEILSTGGTAAHLKENDIEVVDVSDYTGFPELFDGRVKTINPKIAGGILYQRDNKQHVADAEANEIGPIDIVIVNLYPFEETVAKEDVTLEEAIENIDIGGPSLLRAAAKNYRDVAVLTDHEDYESFLSELEENDWKISLKTRERLAIKAFQKTASYDRAIHTYLNKSQETASSFTLDKPLFSRLRYGDNPHQEASLYGNFGDYFTQIQGKDLSYTNVLDITSAAELITDFRRPTVAILKHTNPCGVGSDPEDLREAWEKAYETDRQAPFGGVIVCNRALTESLARVISQIFTDVIIAPDFEADARALLQKKKNLRLIKMADNFENAKKEPIIRSAPGGFMIMDADWQPKGLNKIEEKVVTERPPTAEEIEAMRFGWRIVKHVKSNAIVFAGPDRTLGIGAGQMSRVDSTKIAVAKAKEAGLSLEGSIVASDALFPFADGLLAAAEAGSSAAIQPGGSIRDEEVIQAANEKGMAMVFTGHRHFKH